ncbi:hypothetical protein FBEOM_5277 [Fusarium beomiforme]|uniref:Uncharacterized protein n=1 Tax=Fusarium beomiforme TaxID=44412 RepID=A0A9P5DZ56_9HYPO|nr:hypothetical protein FBEOM_5277 [Fusarium beomiforme]
MQDMPPIKDKVRCAARRKQLSSLHHPEQSLFHGWPELYRLQCSLPQSHEPKDKEPDVSNSPQQLNTRLDPGSLERLAALEAAVSEIKQYLGWPTQGSTLQKNANHAQTSVYDAPGSAVNKGSDGFMVQPSSTPATHSTAQSGPWSSAPNEETAPKTAPIQVVRRLNKIITDEMPAPGQLPDITLSQLSSIGFEIDGLGLSLFRGFERMLAPIPFMTVDFEDLKMTNTPLLAACILAGFQTIPSLLGSDLHMALHKLVRDRLSKAILNTPVHMSVIQIMIIFSAWNLGMPFHAQYIDSWMMSGSALLHLTLSCGDVVAVESLEAISTRGEYSSEIRAWIVTVLVHLKFAVGVGQHVALDHSYLEKLSSLVVNPSVDPSLFNLVLELRLYIILYSTVIKRSISVDNAWLKIEEWAKSYNTNRAGHLNLAYLSVSLTLIRWELVQVGSISQSYLDRIAAGEQRSSTLVKVALDRSQQLLQQLASLHPPAFRATLAHDFLIGAYAALTLTDFSAYIDDVQPAVTVMESVLAQRHQFETTEPVLAWATEVMRARLQANMEQDVASLIPGAPTDWIPDILIGAVPLEEGRENDDFMIPV